MIHMVLFPPETSLAHEYGRKWLPVDFIVFEGNLYFYLKNQECSLGSVCYFPKNKTIRPKRYIDPKFVNRIVAFPDEIGFVFNQGPPHDHNYNYTNGDYLEILHPDTIVKIMEGKYLVHIEVDHYFETGFEGPLPYSPIYFDNKIVLNLKEIKSFI